MASAGPRSFRPHRYGPSLAKAGFGDVATYINTSERGSDEVLREVADIAHARFGFTKDIMVASAAEWAKLLSANPFPRAVETPTRLHAFLLEKAPAKKRWLD